MIVIPSCDIKHILSGYRDNRFHKFFSHRANPDRRCDRTRT